ncbi:MAG TPA: hypothetical protein VJS68_00860, partial [Thermoplasmata archaeon]|nr:hypothetical protein [Thermoplasmata archaeon]
MAAIEAFAPFACGVPLAVLPPAPGAKGYRLIRIVPVVVVLLLALLAPSAHSVAAAPFHPSFLGQAGPMVLSHGSFAIEQVTQASSGAFASNPGDAIFVWVSIYGRDTVAAVSDSARDAYTQLVNASMAFGTSGAYNGLSLWMASNVSGGNSVVLTVQLHARFATSLNDSAVVFADVTGVAAQPLDALGPVMNSSSLPLQQSRNYSSLVSANGTDILLSGVAARNYDNFSPSGTDQRVDQGVGVLTKASLNAMTMAVFQAPQGPVAGATWLNATDNQSAAWIASALALRASGPLAPPEYWVTLTETGLVNGTLWGASVDVSNATAIAPGLIRVAEPNGTYLFGVNPVVGYSPTPTSGPVTVNGTGAAIGVTFSLNHDITFNASGLASGTPWWVTLDGHTLSATAPTTIVDQEVSGSYSFQAYAAGYSADPLSGVLVVNNNSITTT